MSSLERAYQQAFNAKQIEGAVLEGRTRSNLSYSWALGERTLLDGNKKPFGPDDIFFLASATKLLTTIAALQCCERNQLSLDADITPSLSAIAKLGVLNTYDEATGLPDLTPISRKLTLRHLLTHSSGLEYQFFNPAIARWYEESLSGKAAPDVPSRFTQPLAFQPGEGWGYGPGLDWAGHIVEQVSGMKLDDYFRSHLLSPIGINGTEVSFFPVKEGFGDRMPDLNPSDPNGTGLSASNGFNIHGDVLEACFGGQGAYMSAKAYIAILQSILANDEKLLSKESVTEMFKPQLELKARQALQIRLDSPTGQFFSQGTAGKHRDYGLGGLLVGEHGDAGMGKHCLTWGGGVNSVWLLDPARDVCGFVCPQLILPADVEQIVALKAIFRRNIVEKFNRR